MATEANYVTRDELRADLAEMKVDLIKWMVGTGLGIAAVTATLAGIILRRSPVTPPSSGVRPPARVQH